MTSTSNAPADSTGADTQQWEPDSITLEWTEQTTTTYRATIPLGHAQMRLDVTGCSRQEVYERIRVLAEHIPATIVTRLDGLACPVAKYTVHKLTKIDDAPVEEL